MIAAPRASLPRHRTSRQALPGFTVVELMVVVAIIIVLVGILLVALSGGRAQAHMAKSMSSLKQIGTWMTLYSGENRDTIVPSQFNYQEAEYKGKPRAFPDGVTPAAGEEHRGTWTDILWTRYADSSFPEAAGFPDCGGNDYKFDSPDNTLYGHLGEDIKSPFRSSAKNTRNAQVDEPFDPTIQPLPFGPGAQARGEPGYFAANNFFNADHEATTSPRWWSQGQIALPAKSLYAIDSWAGEVIEVNQGAGPDFEPDCAPWDFSDGAVIAPSGGGGGGSLKGQVDFRYQDAALILFLDNHVKPETPWETLDQLQGQGQGQRGIRVRELDSDSSPTPCP